jgi:hypothetical protein
MDTAVKYDGDLLSPNASTVKLSTLHFGDVTKAVTPYVTPVVFITNYTMSKDLSP